MSSEDDEVGGETSFIDVSATEDEESVGAVSKICVIDVAISCDRDTGQK